MEEYNKNTLEGHVDLEKVREIRRAIRRRYANRKNFQKIFNLWDEDSKGAISVKNLYNMIHRLGLNVNLDEARVLVASSDKDCSNDLAIEEFLDLIFNEKDALNVDLK
jgi:Ca2+-binding EF-hand superfamily protein